MALQRLRFHNPSFHTPLRVWVEPWGDGVTIEPRDSVEVVISGPEDGSFEVEVCPEAIVVYGWEGSAMCVMRGRPVVLDY
jgi:hypothetical protein